MRSWRPRLASGTVLGVALGLSSLGCTSSTPGRLNIQRSAPVRRGTEFQLPTASLVLKNGMRMVFHEDHRAPIVSVQMVVGSGSVDDPAGRSGFAHLFEHLMFSPTANRAHMTNELQELGSLSHNAMTTNDNTMFFESGPSNTLNSILFLEADRFANITSGIWDSSLRTERNVVLNELRQNSVDRPGSGSALRALATLYPESHPYHRPTIGSIADLESATNDDVAAFFYDQYVPANVTMVVAGDFHIDQAAATAAELFERIPARPYPKQVSPGSTSCPACPTTQTTTDTLQVPTIRFFWALPAGIWSFDPNIEIVERWLDNPEGELSQAIVSKRKLATRIDVNFQPAELGVTMVLNASVSPGVEPKVLAAAISTELERLSETGIPKQQFETAKSQILIDQRSALETIEGKGRLIATIVAATDSTQEINKVLNRFDVVTADSSWAALRTMTQSRKLVQTALPSNVTGDESILAAPSSSIASQVSGTTLKRPASRLIKFTRPKLEKHSLAVVPDAVTSVLSNGIPLSYFELAGQSNVHITVLVNGGTERDPVGSEGQSDVLAELLTQGAEKRDGDAFQRTLASLGASMQARSQVGGYGIHLASPAASIEATLGLLLDAIFGPQLNPERLDQLKRDSSASIARLAKSGQALADREMSRIFPSDSPRSRQTTINSLSTLSTSKIRAEHSMVFRPENMSIVASGSLPFKTIRAMLDKRFGVRPRLGNPLELFSDPRPKHEANETLLIDIPGSAQSSIQLVYVPKMTNTVQSEVAISYISGAINDRLRYGQGVSYGANGDAVEGRSFSVVRLSASVETSATADAISTMIEEAKGSEHVQASNSDRQAAFTRNVAYQQAISLLQSSELLVKEFTRVYFEQRPWTANKSGIMRRQSANYTDVTTAKKAVALQSGHLVIVAGDLAKLRDSLDEAELGTIRTISPAL